MVWGSNLLLLPFWKGLSGKSAYFLQPFEAFLWGGQPSVKRATFVNARAVLARGKSGIGPQALSMLQCDLT